MGIFNKVMASTLGIGGAKIDTIVHTKNEERHIKLQNTYISLKVCTEFRSTKIFFIHRLH